MVGSALARMVVSSEPMKTGSSTPSTTSMVSRWDRAGLVMGGPASMPDYVPPLSFRDGAERRARNPVQFLVVASGFRVRTFGAPRNDSRAFSFGVLDRLPDRVRRRRHHDVGDAAIAQRIDDAADDH